MKPQFQQEVLNALDEIVVFLRTPDADGNRDPMGAVAKPILKLATPSLRKALETEPEKVYKTLKAVSERLAKAIAVYEVEG